MKIIVHFEKDDDPITRETTRKCFVGNAVEFEDPPDPPGSPAPYVPLGEIETRQGRTILIARKIEVHHFAMSTYPDDCRVKTIKLVHGYNIGMRAVKLAQYVVDCLEHGAKKITPDGIIYPVSKAILADLDAGPVK